MAGAVAPDVIPATLVTPATLITPATLVILDHQDYPDRPDHPGVAARQNSDAPAWRPRCGQDQESLT
jgi:hypothetical protein